jgi:alkyldihydroxyacetonephosphate synthase
MEVLYVNMTERAPTPITALQETLRNLIPPELVRSDRESLQAYQSDWSWEAIHAQAAGRPEGRPDIVVRPRNVKEVIHVVRSAAQHGVPIVPWGRGTGVQGASIPIRGGLIVDLSGLTAIREINEQAMTVTVEAGLVCDRLEEVLNARGLTFPHYPASSWLSTIGGYVSCRGAGVMSTRYGKIEDLVLSLEVVLPDGSLTQTLAVPSHACGPDLAGLFIGTEGTFGIITAVTVQIKPLPEARCFRTLTFPSLAAGLEAGRRIMHDELYPPVMRLHDISAATNSLSKVVGTPLNSPTAILVFQGRSTLIDVEARLAVQHALDCGGHELDPEISETWWNHRFDFYHPPHYPTLPSIWGTVDVVATYDRIMPTYQALQETLVSRFAAYHLRLNTHLSHWYNWGTMLYARFTVPQGPTDPLLAEHLNKEIWQTGIDIALRCGAIMNSHHGVGLKLAPFLERQYGSAYPTLMSIKRAIDPQGIMNPGKWLDDYHTQQ